MKTLKPQQIRQTRQERTCRTCRHWACVDDSFGLCAANTWRHSGDSWQSVAGDSCGKWAPMVKPQYIVLPVKPYADDTQRIQTPPRPATRQGGGIGREVKGKRNLLNASHPKQVTKRAFNVYERQKIIGFLLPL